MFVNNGKSFQNNFNSNIKNDKYSIITECPLQQTADRGQNASEELKTLTANKSHLRQNNATFA